MRNSRKLRKLYAELTGKELPGGFDVHHINFNPQDNDILNLVSLPQITHSEYHRCLDKLGSSCFSRNSFIPNQSSNFLEFQLNYFHESLEDLLKIGKIYSEICHWINFRNYLLKRFSTPTGGHQY
jgi:hypothetical protein